MFNQITLPIIQFQGLYYKIILLTIKLKLQIRLLLLAG